ncbi:MAG TPA: hypothetical protein VLS89_13050 [Candidatus Nanopelagicales bacterium]|nr:hypothetical protein [Candidatus Nanopelagicales bacterium]
MITPDQGGTVTLDYDAAQRRIRKTTLDEQTVYVGGLYERVTNFATGEIEHRYHVHGAERRAACRGPGSVGGMPGRDDAKDLNWSVGMHGLEVERTQVSAVACDDFIKGLP